VGWLAQHHPQLATSDAFVSRCIYGKYVRDLLEKAQVQSHPSVRFEHRRGEVIAIERGGKGIELIFRRGNIVWTDYAVVALGNSYSNGTPAPQYTPSGIANYFASPWQPDALRNLEKNAPVLIIGCGLTAVDTILSLEAQGHRGVIHAVSRHGLLPQVHAHRAGSTAVDFSEVRIPPMAKSIRGLLAAIRGKIAKVHAQGGDWRLVIDGLRPFTNEIWQGLPVREQRRFLRHLSAIWDVHRHRMAPEVGDLITTLRKQGRLFVHAGRVQSLAADDNGFSVRVRLRHSGEEVEFQAERAINCAGFICHYSEIGHPLLRNLLAGGEIAPGPLGIGFMATGAGQLLRPDGEPSEGLFMLGPCRRGPLFESVAVPEIGVQAAELAQHLVALATAKEAMAARHAVEYGGSSSEESIASLASPSL
jgi:uncharacterized NAD(P)/FAD-binding protein YdhS